ncbi:hypothetical protein RHMOL_Rhmol02G0134100 [Rhododendron molle]|nr:hypothetical protein RHMOL_Rhmol02G0134100 [Rhododendron molle]
MDEEVKSKKSRETGTFTGEAWKRIRSELIRLTGYSYTKEQVKNKYNVLCILFNKFNSLKANSGVGWDSTLLTVIAPDYVWERLFKVGIYYRLFTLVMIEDTIIFQLTYSNVMIARLINLRGNSKKRDAILPCCAVYLETRLPLEHMLTLQTKSLLVVIVRIQNFSLKMSQKLKVLKVLYVASMTNTDEKFTDKSRL